MKKDTKMFCFIWLISTIMILMAIFSVKCVGNEVCKKFMNGLEIGIFFVFIFGIFYVIAVEKLINKKSCEKKVLNT